MSNSDEELVEEDTAFRDFWDNNLEIFENSHFGEYSENYWDYKSCPNLHLAVEKGMVKSFDYLITLEGIDLGCHNSAGETPLTLACKRRDSYFAKRLIQIGANVNQCSIDGTSPLHYAIENCLETAGLLIEKGAVVNYKQLKKLTPLDIACRNNNYDAIHMLLYYGAVVSMIDHSTLMDLMTRAPLNCQETLLLHYLDEIDKVDLDFISMIIARKFELFSVVLERITEVDCDSGNLCCDIYDVEQLVVLLKKFPDFRDFFYQEFPISSNILDDSVSLETFSKLIYRLAEESLLFSDFLETYEPDLIMWIVYFYEEFNMCKDKLTELILILTSYGLPVCFEDFLQVHSYFGNGFLVKLFLHNTIELPLFILPKPWSFQSLDLMSVLLYKPNFNFNCDMADYPPEFMNGIIFKCMNPLQAFHYFANGKFRKFVSEVYPNSYKSNVLLQRPQFPSLIELSRNACHRFIYSKWEISDQKPGKYYDIVKRLPVYNYCKQILTFEVELYSV